MTKPLFFAAAVALLAACSADTSEETKPEVTSTDNGTLPAEATPVKKPAADAPRVIPNLEDLGARAGTFREPIVAPAVTLQQPVFVKPVPLNE